jgi:hypothetical protein
MDQLEDDSPDIRQTALSAFAINVWLASRLDRCVHVSQGVTHENGASICSLSFASGWALMLSRSDEGTSLATLDPDGIGVAVCTGHDA